MPKIKIDECEKLLSFSQQAVEEMSHLAETSEEREALQSIGSQFNNAFSLVSGILKNLNAGYLKKIESKFHSTLRALDYSHLYDRSEFLLKTKTSLEFTKLHHDFSALSQTMRLMHMIQLYILLETFTRNVDIKLKVGLIPIPQRYIQKYLVDNFGGQSDALREIVDQLIFRSDEPGKLDTQRLADFINQYISMPNVPGSIKEILTIYVDHLTQGKTLSTSKSYTDEDTGSEASEESDITFSGSESTEEEDTASETSDVFFDADDDLFFEALEVHEFVQNDLAPGEDYDHRLKLATDYLQHACELDAVIVSEINNASGKYKKDVLKELNHQNNRLLKYIDSISMTIVQLKNKDAAIRPIEPFEIRENAFNSMLKAAKKRKSLFGKKPPKLASNTVDLPKASQLNGTVFDHNQSPRVPTFFAPIINTLKQTEIEDAAKKHDAWFEIKSTRKR